MAKSSKDKPTKKAAPKDAEEKPGKASSKPVKPADDDEAEDDFVDEEAPKKGAKSAKGKSADDDDDEDVDVDDDWEKVEEDEDWDPDFDEFDIPKSKAKKSSTGGGKSKKEEDDLGLDDEFKDMDLFNDSGFD